MSANSLWSSSCSLLSSSQACLMWLFSLTSWMLSCLTTSSSSLNCACSPTRRLCSVLRKKYLDYFLDDLRENRAISLVHIFAVFKRNYSDHTAELEIDKTQTRIMRINQIPHNNSLLMVSIIYIDWLLIQSNFPFRRGHLVWLDKGTMSQNKGSPSFPNIVHKEGLKHGNNPPPVCLHLARCWFPTLGR